MTKPLFQFALLSIVWFLIWASVSGPLGLYVIATLKKNGYSSTVMLWGAMVVYGCGAISVYVGVLYYKVIGTPLYDVLSVPVLLFVGSAPFLIAAVVAFWLLRHLRFGW